MEKRKPAAFPPQPERELLANRPMRKQDHLLKRQTDVALMGRQMGDVLVPNANDP